MLLEIILTVMVILFVTSCYVIWNLSIKQEMLESWIGNFINTIEKVNNDLKRADYKGSFEADDEVGTIFKEIKIIISQLDQFKGEEQ
jgi:hypothetical protein|tara:strand:- start:735 stop:995 length:261 start_codon:yes stop_codon:yes gene_type:complete